MITQELVEYIKKEIAKGRTREDIRQVLISGGGWNEDDLSEAFREVIPMQNIVPPSPAVPEKPEIEKPIVSFISPVPPPPSPILASMEISKPRFHLLFSFFKFMIILIVVCGIGFGVWFYRSQIIKLWPLSILSSQKI